MPDPANAIDKTLLGARPSLLFAYDPATDSFYPVQITANDALLVQLAGQDAPEKLVVQVDNAADIDLGAVISKGKAATSGDTELEFATAGAHKGVKVLLYAADGTALYSIPPALADDSAFSVASSLVTPMGAVADESAPDSVDEGDIGAPRMTLNRILKVVPTLSNGNGNGPTAGAQDHQQALYGDALIASAVYSASQGSPTQYNINHRGILIQLNIDANPGGGETLTLQVQVKIGNGAFITIFQSAALTANNRYNYAIHPNWGAATNEITAVGNYALPRTWQINMAHSAAGNWTYDLQFSYLD